MLRRDPKGKWETGWWVLERKRNKKKPTGFFSKLVWEEFVNVKVDAVRFVTGRLSWNPIPVREHEKILSAQDSTAVAIGCHDETGRTYWMFQNNFYWDDENHTAEEVTALILERTSKKEARVAVAVAKMQHSISSESTDRMPIPDDVKMFVWRRDQGRCAQCGIAKELEFDHIIPLSMGGSNTARNLQLLCGPCNRAKGGNLA